MWPICGQNLQHWTATRWDEMWKDAKTSVFPWWLQLIQRQKLAFSRVLKFGTVRSEVRILSAARCCGPTTYNQQLTRMSRSSSHSPTSKSQNTFRFIGIQGRRLTIREPDRKCSVLLAIFCANYKCEIYDR